MTITENYQQIRAEIPDHVTIVAAAKTRTTDELKMLIDAGIADIGENYIQEAEVMRKALGDDAKRVRWHFIGHLQTNKINKALELFDVIQTLDSIKLARAIDKRAETVMPILIEINSGREPQKTGLLPEDTEQAVREIAPLKNLSIKGLMTMGPRFGNPEDARPHFRETKKLFDHIASLNIPGVEMDVLSMGMSNAYGIAIEEGSTLIRPGTLLFGERMSC
jgi:PLP dependent protein